MRKSVGKGQKGFTLIEMVVVLAIMGILAAIVTPLVTHQLSQAAERAWTGDKESIQKAVDIYLGKTRDDPDWKWQGEGQFPIKGMLVPRPVVGALSTNFWSDTDSSTSLTSPDNPLQGTRGGEPKWRDGGDGIRSMAGSASEENLNAEAQAVAGSGSGWYVVKVASGGKDFAVDSRNFIIDMDKLTIDDKANGKFKLLNNLPKSASPDNKAGATGSYTWYVNADRTVNSLYYHFPTNGNGPGTGVTVNAPTATAPGSNNGADNRGFIKDAYP